MLHGSNRIFLGGHGVIMLSRKSSAVSAFVLKLLFTKFQLVCYVLYKNKHIITFDLMCSFELEEMQFPLILSMLLNV